MKSEGEGAVKLEGDSKEIDMMVIKTGDWPTENKNAVVLLHLQEYVRSEELSRG